MFNKKPVERLARYQDPSGEFSNRSLKLAKWYVLHKILIRKITVIILSIWSVFSIGMGIWIWGKYAVYDYSRDDKQIEQLTRTYARTDVLHATRGPLGLVAEEVVVYQAGSESYHLTAQVTNPNKNWIANLTYEFVMDSEKTQSVSVAVMPDTKQPVIFSGFKSPSFPNDAQLRIVDIAWLRVDPHKVANPALYMEERLRFGVENIVILKGEGTNAKETELVEFDLVNQSVYSYWEPLFYVWLMNEERVVGVTSIVPEQLHAGERRHISLSSYPDRLRITHVQISPIINVFDPGVFMPPGQ